MKSQCFSIRPLCSIDSTSNTIVDSRTRQFLHLRMTLYTSKKLMTRQKNNDNIL